jgi:hypothetical protein
MPHRPLDQSEVKFFIPDKKQIDKATKDGSRAEYRLKYVKSNMGNGWAIEVKMDGKWQTLWKRPLYEDLVTSTIHVGSGKSRAQEHIAKIKKGDVLFIMPGLEMCGMTDG